MKNSNVRKIMTLAMVLAMCLGTTSCGMIESANDSDSPKPAAAVTENNSETMDETETADVSETDTVSETASVAESIAPSETVSNTESDYPAFVDDQNATAATDDNTRGPSYMGTFTAQRLFGMTVSEAVEMGTDSWQTAPQGIQAAPEWGELYGCTALQGYAFASTNGYDGTIDCINVLSGGYVNDNIYVGMTYNELCDALGKDIGIEWTNDDLYFSSVVTIDGKTWHIGFDLTAEQSEEIHSRLFAEDGAMPEGAVSISDIDPVSTVAVHYPVLDN